MEFSYPGSSLYQASPCRKGIMLAEVLAGGASFVIGQSLNWATRALEAKLLNSAKFANKAVLIHKAVQGLKNRSSGALPVADQDPNKIVARAASSVSYYAVSAMGGASTCGAIALACIMNGNKEVTELSETVHTMDIKLEKLMMGNQGSDSKADSRWDSLKKEFQESQVKIMENHQALLALSGRVTILEGKGGNGGKE